MRAALVRPELREAEQRARQIERAGLLEWERCRRCLLYYCEHYVWTVDEHERDEPVRPLLHGIDAIDPQTLQLTRDLDGSEDDYLRYVTLAWEREPLLAVPKSRQMRLTHAAVAWHGWLAQYYPGQRIAIQSKNFEDADALLGRLDKSWEAQREKAPWIQWPTYKKTEGRIVLPNGSILMAIAQGADKLRSYTFSAILSDEMGFQDKAEEAYAAAVPTIEGGGKYTAISSANPGFFQSLVFDRAGSE
jgi:hypothetical protein